MNTSRGHQAPRKPARCLQKEAGQNIKDKKRDKRVRDSHDMAVIIQRVFPQTIIKKNLLQKPNDWPHKKENKIENSIIIGLINSDSSNLN